MSTSSERVLSLSWEWVLCPLVLDVMSLQGCFVSHYVLLDLSSWDVLCGFSYVLASLLPFRLFYVFLSPVRVLVRRAWLTWALLGTPASLLWPGVSPDSILLLPWRKWSTSGKLTVRLSKPQDQMVHTRSHIMALYCRFGIGRQMPRPY